MTEGDDGDELIVSGEMLSLVQDGSEVILTLVHDNEKEAATTFAAMKECLDDGMLTISLSLEGEKKESIQ